jgi:sugar transferase (PEP-CTERM system associated)
MIKVFKHYIPINYLWLLIIEWLILIVALYLGIVVRFTSTASWYPSEQTFLASFIFGLVFTISFSAFGLYRRSMDHEENMLLVRVLLSTVLAICLLTFLYYFLPTLFLARSVLSYSVLFAFAGLLTSRFIFYRFVGFDRLKRRVLVIGCGSHARKLSELHSTYLHSGYKIVGYADLGTELSVINNPLKIENQGDIINYSKKLMVDEIVIAINDRRNNLPVDEIMDLKMSGIAVVDLLTFYEREQRLLLLESLTPGWLIFSDGFAKNELRFISKRFFDIVASLVLLSLSWWVMLLTVLAIYIECGWGAPVFYRQMRVGENNRLFNVIKFRSMVQNAETDGAKWAHKNDNRITRVGKFIRKYRIDELPQLFNVLNGEMSFVGPRPERPEFVEGFIKTIPYYKERHRVKPGITGWAQLCYPYGASEEDTRRKLEYDLYYVKNYCSFLDLTIILGTIEVILWGKGAR